jgi:hypothetical protein
VSIADEEPEAYSRVTDLVTGKEGIVLGTGDEEALVRFPLTGDLWVPYGDLAVRVIGDDGR